MVAKGQDYGLVDMKANKRQGLRDMMSLYKGKTLKIRVSSLPKYHPPYFLPRTPSVCGCIRDPLKSQYA